MIGYYAAGARVFGLTEKQIQKHMETLKARHAAGDDKSPYAEPLHIVFGQGKKRKCGTRRPHARSILTAPVAALQLHQDRAEKDIHPGRIRLKFQIMGLNQEGRIGGHKDSIQSDERVSMSESGKVGNPHNIFYGVDRSLLDLKTLPTSSSETPFCK